MGSWLEIPLVVLVCCLSFVVYHLQFFSALLKKVEWFSIFWILSFFHRRLPCLLDVV